jgi:hypothetical protein
MCARRREISLYPYRAAIDRSLLANERNTADTEVAQGLLFLFLRSNPMSDTPLRLMSKAALATLTLPFALGTAHASVPTKDTAPAASAATPGAPSASTRSPSSSAAGVDTNADGKPDAWDRDANGRADAWDTNGDGKPDTFDADGDGKPDGAAPATR